MRTRERICRRKNRFPDVGDARAAAKASGLLLLPYRCDRCGAVHLSSRTKGKRLPREETR